MTLRLSFPCALPNGLHARPASLIERICNTFDAEIVWMNKRSGLRCNAKSVLALIGTDTLHQDDCELIVSGPDESEAMACLADFIEKEFPHCDAPSAFTSKDTDGLPAVPRSLANLAPQMLRARPVSDGIGRGRMVRINTFDFAHLDIIAAWEGERERLTMGLVSLRNVLRDRQGRATGTEAEVLKAHVSIADDTELEQRLYTYVEQGRSAAQAIAAVAEYYGESMKNSQSELIREREMDLRDVCLQLAQEIYGISNLSHSLLHGEDVICLAEQITPAQFIALDKAHCKGLVLANGGSTSHTVILARSFNIPTLIGIDIESLAEFEGMEVIVDADVGAVIIEMTEEVDRYYQFERAVKGAFATTIEAFQNRVGVTADGHEIEIAANIALPVEAAPAFAAGAQSIGLFRTEMMFMDRPMPPSEDDQYHWYRQAIDAAQGRIVIVRTIDIGGDKPLNYLHIPAESNPVLGYRAVRIYPEFIGLFKTQLRAILRASALGPLKIMIPMISSLEEILWSKQVLTEVKNELRTTKQPFDESIPLGIMLEVPSIAYIIDQCCEELDFFSIGSNDLTQYLLAVDRDNIGVSRNYNILNPALLRALDYIVSEVHRYGKWIGLCGEIGGKAEILPLLVGMGLDEISMGAQTILATKASLARLDTAECRRRLELAKACRTSREVEKLLTSFQTAGDTAPLICPQCVMLDADFRSKEEVIKALTDRLFLDGRCRYPNKLADDVWEREDAFSTGVDYRFAIPHAISEHIEQSTISIARLSNPIAWGEVEVQFVIMLTLNRFTAAKEHLRIFSRLARRIENEVFRATLTEADNATEVVALLRQDLLF